MTLDGKERESSVGTWSHQRVPTLQPAGLLETRRTRNADGEQIKAELPKIPETRVTTTPDART